MKVVFPQNIQKGIFAGLQISIGSFTISIIQLFLMAIGIVFALVTFSACSKGGAKALGIILAVIILIIFIFVTFFKVSELNLLGFIAKKIRDSWLSTTKKFQVNYPKAHPIDLMIAKTHQEEKKKKIEFKSTIDLESIEKIDKGGLL